MKLFVEKLIKKDIQGTQLDFYILNSRVNS